MKQTLKQKVLLIVLSGILASLMSITGCSNRYSCDVLYLTRVTGDGAGGTITLYDIIKSSSQRDFYAQKINADGLSLWGERGVLIGSGNKKSDALFKLQIVSDNAGGAIVALATYSPPERGSYEYQLSRADIARIDTEGSILWQRETVSADLMISDGDGGAIVAGIYGDKPVIIKIDSEGGFPWGEDGVFIDSRGYQDSTLQLASDGTGGAIIIWQEEIELQAGTDTQNPLVEHMILAQRINSEGNLTWDQGGVTLYTTRENVSAFELRIVSDDSGGVIAVWSQVPLNIYAQKLDADGNIMWQSNGVSLEINRPIAAESDGSGGAIIAWRKTISGIFVQRIGTDGNMIWQPCSEGILPAESGWSVRHDMVVDSNGGSIITLMFRDDTLKKQGIILHKLDSLGNTVWQVNDIGVDADDMGVDVRGITGYFITSDGEGGVIVFWGIGETSSSSGKSFVQRIDSQGNLLWGAAGIRLDQ